MRAPSTLAASAASAVRVASAMSAAGLLLATSCSSGGARSDGDGNAEDAAAFDATASDAASSDAPGEAGDAPPDDGLDGVLVYPDPNRTWEGALLVRTGGPVSSWTLDGVPLVAPTPRYPELLLDTRHFADGEHALSIKALMGDGLREFHGKVTFGNGPPGGPALSGAFTDITSTIAIRIPASPALQDHLGAIAADVDGDGDQDLFVWAPYLRSGKLYLQTGPLEFVASGADLGVEIHAAGFGDLDGDGRPELVTAGNELHVLKVTAGAFVDVTDAAGVAELPGARRDYKGVTLVDVDDDGLLDVVVARLDCTGTQSPNRILRNEGDLHFVDIAPAMGLDLPGANTFAIAVDRVGTDGALHVWPYQDSCQGAPLGLHYRFAEGADLPVLIDAKAPKDNIAPMGGTVIDADHDGLVDELIAGCVSSPLRRAPDFEGSLGPYVGLDAFPDPEGHFITSWSMATLDADLDGLPDVYATHNPSDPLGNGNGSRDALFRQRAPGHFRDVAQDVGLAGYQPCRSVQVADLDGDGDGDLLVGCTQSVRVLRNDLVDPSPGRTLALHGSLSNPDGVNALIASPTGELRLVRGGGNPYAGGTSRESLRAPTGTLTITWPSGIVQRVDAGPGPLLDVFEPDVVSVTPRRVLASAPAPVQIRISPSALGDPAATVTVTASAGTFTTPMHLEADGAWRGTLAPPAAVTTLVLQVTVGAQKLRVRPRVYVR
jgi:hypothetical protein